MTIFVVAGTFDGLHEGHRELFDILSIIAKPNISHALVNGDNMITKRKGIQLIYPQKVRRSMIRNEYPLTNVDIMRDLDEIKEWLLSRSEHDDVVLLHGDDYTTHSLSALYGVDGGWWKDHNITLLFCHRSTGMSSTILRQRYQNRPE